MSPSEHLSNNRKIGQQRQIEDAERKQRQQRSAFFAGASDDRYLSTGGADVGGLVQREQNTGVGQVRSLHRTEPQEELEPIFATYPFKTLLLAGDNKIYLGGDRTPQLLTSPTSRPFEFGLVNSGGKDGYISSYRDRTTSPSKFKFYNPVMSVDVTSKQNNGLYIGEGIWLDSFFSAPFVDSNRVTISGDPPSNVLTTSGTIDPESGGSSTGKFNFNVRYDYTGYLTGAITWPPYNAGTFSGGSYTWQQSTLFNGTPYPTGRFYYQWQNLDHDESYSNGYVFPIRCFSYSKSIVEPNLGHEGTLTKIYNSTTQTNQNRAVDFSSLSINKNVNSYTAEISNVPIVLAGNQSRVYYRINSTSVLSNLIDTRSTGASGASANKNFTQSINFLNKTINPFQQLLLGDKCAFVVEKIEGTSETREINETHAITSGTRTQVIRPGMTSPIFGYGDYMVSASLTGQGPLGGWHAGGNPQPGDIGQPAPSPSIYRRGIAVDTGFAFNAANAKFFRNQNDPEWFSNNSFFYAFFDSSYTDNSTNANVYSEYTYTHALDITSIYNDIYGASALFNWSYPLNEVSTTTIDYFPTERYLFLTETETLEIEAEPSASLVAINSNIVTVPVVGSTGTITLSTINGIGIGIKTSDLIQKKEIKTRNLTYTNAIKTTDTLHTETRYTTKNYSLIGQKVELYKQVDDVITCWYGTVASYAGNNTPAIPSASGTTGAGRTFSNVFIGGVFKQTISVTNMVITVTDSKIVRFSPYRIINNTYTLIINPDFLMPMNSDACNLRSGTGTTLASTYVCNSSLYKPGKTNYAAVWDFVRQQDGKCKIVKRDKLVKGSTRADTGVTGEELKAVQYFG